MFRWPRSPIFLLSEATQKLLAHLQPLAPDSFEGKASLALVPVSRGEAPDQIAIGSGLSYRLVWVLHPRFDAQFGEWEALVDAGNGNIVAFEDKANYLGAEETREVIGGVFPLSNDGNGPDGTEQAGWPMPYADVTTPGGTLTTDAGGNVTSCIDGSISTSLSGPYMAFTDTCGAINESTTGAVLDFGTNAPPSIDCQVAPGASAGNTHATRTGFYELNKMAEMGRSHLPDNVWLQNPLPVLMNIALNCNATGGAGGLRFYQSGGGCNNTGEIAGVFDHEWGHGMDASDANPGFSSPSEANADIYATLRLATSCMGRGFFNGNACGGYGDPCIGAPACDGVREMDWAQHASNAPHTMANYVLDGMATPNGGCTGFGTTLDHCGAEVHCSGMIPGEAVYDLLNRDLPAAGFDSNTSREIVSRLVFTGMQLVGNWYTCTGNGFDGCNADGGYMNFLVADDDDNNLNNGTPHMQQIFDAFNRHGIACATPTVQNSGCAGSPTVAPVVSATPLDRGAELTWAAVAGANSYRIFRGEGIDGCAYGKTFVAETADTSYFATELANGREYNFIVVPVGASASCYGPSSSCTVVTPSAGANFFLTADASPLTINTGDSDAFLDNCEEANFSFGVENIGTGSLTNLRIDSVTAPGNGTVDSTITFTSAISASLSECSTAAGSFDFVAADLAPGGSLDFEVCVTSDELSPLTRCFPVGVSNAESDIQFFASRTFSFDADFDSWTQESGTYTHTAAGGDPGGHLRSTAALDNACDRALSPLMGLSGTSTLSMSTNFDIEPFSGGTWYDRANVAAVELDGTRTVLEPDGGRTYNAGPGGPGAFSGCNDPDTGWADANATWAGSTWSTGALGGGGFGGMVNLQVTYATDGALANGGFWFDTVTVTDVDLQVEDAQSNFCAFNGIFTDGFESGDTSAWTLTFP